MKFCPKCGKQQLADAKFCSYCGAPISVVKDAPLSRQQQPSASIANQTFKLSTLTNAINNALIRFNMASFSIANIASKSSEFNLSNLSSLFIANSDDYVNDIIKLYDSEIYLKFDTPNNYPSKTHYFGPYPSYLKDHPFSNDIAVYFNAVRCINKCWYISCGNYLNFLTQDNITNAYLEIINSPTSGDNRKFISNTLLYPLVESYHHIFHCLLKLGNTTFKTDTKILESCFLDMLTAVNQLFSLFGYTLTQKDFEYEKNSNFNYQAICDKLHVNSKTIQIYVENNIKK